MFGYGLNKQKIDRIFQDKLREDPDLFYYLGNPHAEKLANLLIEAFVEVIEKNNKKLAEDLLSKMDQRR